MVVRARGIGAQSAEYYSAENSESKRENRKFSEWTGKAAEDFGLEGKVNRADFEQLLQGNKPNGEQFRTRKPTQEEHKERAGIDLTFSAPKSVSLAVLVNGDKQLEKAHQESVQVALKTVEDRYASTRMRQNGERETIQTGNLAIAQFHHDRSRDNDPQLHTHAIIINATKNQNNDDWYSLKNDEIFQNQKFIDGIYQNELANRAKKLGYEIEQNGNSFELKGYSDSQLEHFSKRRQVILKTAGQDASAKSREIAALDTRKPKIKDLTRKELQADWQSQADTIGLIHPVPSPKNHTQQQQTNNDPENLVNQAIAHCSERQTSFKRQDLEEFALNHKGDNSWGEIQNNIDNHQNLLKAQDDKLTTVSALNRELDTIRMVDRGKGQVDQINNSFAVKGKLKDKGLTEGQYNAVISASTNKDRIMAWQGKAGAGKTFALNEFKEIAEAKGYKVKGFAPSASAAQTLGDELGIKSNTVARQIASDVQKKPKPKKPKFKQNSQKRPKAKEEKQIWIVDEAGLLNAKDAHKLLKKAESENARILLVGDTRQLSSVGAGNPFKSLQKSGIKTAYLNQSLRQKTKDLKEAVNSISEGNLDAGFKTLDRNGRIDEIKDSGDRAKQIANDYMKLDSQERDKTLILAGTHRERKEIVKEIRSKLHEEGSLGQDKSVTKLKAKDLSAAEMNFAQNYTKGDILKFHHEDEKLNLHKDQLYKVEKVGQNSLSLRSNSGSCVELDPAQADSKSVYQSEEISIAKGDRLKWTQNNNQLGRINGQEFQVESIEGNFARVSYKNGKLDNINLADPQHFDHDLVNTTYSSQGKTADRVMVSATNDKTLSQESFYVAASRVKNDLKIYAQDKEGLLAKAKESRSQQNPLDNLAENPQEVTNRVQKNLREVFASYLKQQKTDSPQQSKEQNKNTKDKIEQSPSRGMRF